MGVIFNISVYIIDFIFYLLKKIKIDIRFVYIELVLYRYLISFYNVLNDGLFDGCLLLLIFVFICFFLIL